MTTYYLRLVGPKALGERVGGALLRDVLDVMVEGARRAVRLRVEGRSTARGREPRWLPQAAGFDVVGIESGSTVLVLDAPDIESSLDLPELPELDLELRGRATGLGLFRESLEEAVSGRRESDFLDIPLLVTIAELRRVLDGGVDRIEFSNGVGAVTSVDPESLARAEQLKDTTPPDQRVMVSGRLNALRHDSRAFALILENGHTLRGVAEDALLGVLGQLWGKDVLISARAVFKPSGKVLRLEADKIELAPSGSVVWAEEPRSLWSPTEIRDLHQPQGPRNGINAILGQWPGDETDQEVAAFLEELS